MLNLTRRREQKIYIETPLGRITVMVCDYDQYRGVLLGIEAPASINIVRAELVDNVTSESQAC